MNDVITQTGKSFLSFKRDSATYDFPEHFSQYLVEKGDVYFWPEGGFHVVTRAGLAKQVLMNPQFSADRSRFFISRMPNLDLRIIKDFFAVIGKMMVMSDGKEHAARRRAGMVGINEELLSIYEPRIQQVVERLFSSIKKNGHGDFVSEVARILPQSVLAELFSIPEKDRAFFNECSNTMTAFFGGAVEYTNAVGEKVNAAAISIQKYFCDLIEERRTNPKDDFFSKILKAQATLELSDEEIISQAVMMLVAGQVTTTDQICNNFYLLMSRPGLFEQIKKAPEKMTLATEEFKRFDPAVTFLFRVATQDTQLGSQTIKAGDTIFIGTHAINRDPEMFDAPLEMNISRQSNKHFAYGHGAHYCLGARLGRLQMEILFNCIVKSLPSLRLDSEKLAVRDHYSLAFSGFKTIPVVV